MRNSGDLTCHIIKILGAMPMKVSYSDESKREDKKWYGMAPALVCVCVHMHVQEEMAPENLTVKTAPKPKP